MREKLDKFLEKLAVNYILSPYETMPWSHYDETRGLTCSAEVRMGPGGDDIEAEIQFLYDDTDYQEEDETDSSGAASGSGDAGHPAPPRAPIIHGRQQILTMRAEPVANDEWSPKTLTIKGKDFVNDFHDWDVKGCEFFSTCVQSILMGEIPDVDTLIGEKMVDDSWGGGGRRGKVGRKSPKIKPAQLLGGKKM